LPQPGQRPVLADGSEALAVLTSAGGVLIIGISLKLLAVKDVRVGNFLPALVIAPALVMSREQIDTMLDLMDEAIGAATMHFGAEFS